MIFQWSKQVVIRWCQIWAGVDGEPPPISNFQLVPEFSCQYAALRCPDKKAHLSMSDLFSLNKHQSDCIQDLTVPLTIHCGTRFQKKSTVMWPFMFQKTVIITFPVVRADLNFFSTGEDVCFYFMLCCFVSGS